MTLRFLKSKRNLFITSSHGEKKLMRVILMSVLSCFKNNFFSLNENNEVCKVRKIIIIKDRAFEELQYEKQKYDEYCSIKEAMIKIYKSMFPLVKSLETSFNPNDHKKVCSLIEHLRSKLFSFWIKTALITSVVCVGNLDHSNYEQSEPLSPSRMLSKEFSVIETLMSIKHQLEMSKRRKAVKISLDIKGL